jgi:general secretion pathway protein C
MDKFFRTYWRGFQLAFAVLLGMVLAGAVNRFVAAALAPLTVTLPGPDARGAERGGAAASERSDLPFELFGRLAPPADPAEADGCDPAGPPVCDEGQICDPETRRCIPLPIAEEATPSPSDDGRCPPSDIGLALAGTMVSQDPRYSIAILRNPTTSQTQFAVVGDNLLNEAEVVMVERNRIHLLRNGNRECMRTGPPPAPGASGPFGGPTGVGVGTPRRSVDRAAAVEAAPPLASASAARRSPEERIQTEITRGEDGSYSIPRDLIQEVSRNEALLQRQAPQIQPNYENGAPRGLRLQGMRSDSMFSRIGLRNGDVLVAVNGRAVDSPQQAAGMYESMMNETNVAITVLRRGREQTIRYSMR